MKDKHHHIRDLWISVTVGMVIAVAIVTILIKLTL